MDREEIMKGQEKERTLRSTVSDLASVISELEDRVYGANSVAGKLPENITESTQSVLVENMDRLQSLNRRLREVLDSLPL